MTAEQDALLTTLIGLLRDVLDRNWYSGREQRRRRARRKRL